MNTTTAAILALALAASHSSADAHDTPIPRCVPRVTGPYAPHQIASHRRFSLNDPRSGLTLNLESDGRHMTAKTRWGKIVWQRNLFADPKLEKQLSLPPPHVPGEPFSEAMFRQQVRDHIAELFVTGIRVISDCEAQQVDRTNRFFRGHYIEAQSGTKYGYLLDAKTGDFLLSGIN